MAFREEFRQYLIDQTKRSHNTLSRLVRRLPVGKIMVFTLPELEQLVRMVDTAVKNKKQWEDQDTAPTKHRVDCSQTLNYAKEHNRMCEKYFVCPDACTGCPMAEYNCSEPNEITQEHIDILQKWSDENPPEEETP